MGVVVLDVSSDVGDQLAHTLDRAATNALLGDQSKPALDLIEPGRVGGRVMYVIARSRSEPRAHLGLLVRGVVVDDQMDVQLGWHAVIDMTEKGQEFLMPMARLALRDHFSRGDVERGKQSGRAMALIVMRDTLDIAQAHGQHGLRTVQCLNLRLLVDREYQRARRGIQIQAHDVTYFLDKKRISGELEVLLPMWPEGLTKV